MNKLILISTAVLLSGCQVPPTSQSGGIGKPDTVLPAGVAEAAVYPPKPTNYMKMVQNYYLYRLKDPHSAQYQGWILAKAYLGSTPPTYGWLVSVSVNSKNSYGAYTGFQPEFFWIHDGQATPVVDLPYTAHPVKLDVDEAIRHY